MNFNRYISASVVTRLSILVIACLALSACETMEDFYNEVIVASFTETIDETVDEIVEPMRNPELSYCPTCDWIVQEFHGGWETRNSKPYDTDEQCWVARREYEKRDPDVRFRCIHESELN